MFIQTVLVLYKNYFFKAFFDFRSHLEEIPIPLVYDPFIGTVIRLFYGTVQLLICMLPSFLIFKNKNDFHLKPIGIPLLILGGITTVLVFVPDYIIGERIRSYVSTTSVINLVLLLTSYFFYIIGEGFRRIKKSSSETNN